MLHIVAARVGTLLSIVLALIAVAIAFGRAFGG